jgi:hypothetical protein
MSQKAIQLASTLDQQHLKQAMSPWQRIILMTLLAIAGLAAVVEWVIFLISANAFLKTFDEAGQNSIVNASVRGGFAALILGLIGKRSMRQRITPTCSKTRSGLPK